MQVQARMEWNAGGRDDGAVLEIHLSGTVTRERGEWDVNGIEARVEGFGRLDDYELSDEQEREARSALLDAAHRARMETRERDEAMAADVADGQRKDRSAGVR